MNYTLWQNRTPGVLVKRWKLTRFAFMNRHLLQRKVAVILVLPHGFVKKWLVLERGVVIWLSLLYRWRNFGCNWFIVYLTVPIFRHLLRRLGVELPVCLLNIQLTFFHFSTQFKLLPSFIRSLMYKLVNLQLILTVFNLNRVSVSIFGRQRSSLFVRFQRMNKRLALILEPRLETTFWLVFTQLSQLAFNFHKLELYIRSRHLLLHLIVLFPKRMHSQVWLAESFTLSRLIQVTFPISLHLAVDLFPFKTVGLRIPITAQTSLTLVRENVTIARVNELEIFNLLI